MKRMLKSALLGIALVIGSNSPVFCGGKTAFSNHGFPLGKLAIHTRAGETHDFTIEIAATPEHLRQGLMHRQSMPDNHGMLFIRDTDFSYNMWMKDTPMSLDMLFIDRNGRIHYIARNTTPNSTDVISSGYLSRAVLELKAGTTEKLGIRTGDNVTYYLPE